LQVEYPGTYGDGLLRTLQRRLKIWRSEIAHTTVFGAINSQPAVESKASGPVVAVGRAGASSSLAARARLGRRKDWVTFE
jgi:co-chaperonin GroES (HSP10)